ncbi:hypothetical protein [Hyphobacterium sp.]|uniref:hypothetical protein n=1 Tax=Hyphobacterium sp. TaxID=2004662 RepID=UPI003BAA77B4
MISGLLISQAEAGLGAAGETIPGLSFSKFETSIYAEYGLSDRLTLILQLASQRVSQDNNGITDTAEGLSASRAGLQARLWQSGRIVVSAQLAAVIPGGGENIADRPLGDGANGAEARLLIGRSLGTNGFADLQAGYTWRAEGYPEEYRLDATLGWRWAERYQLLAQSFYTQGEADRQRSHRAFRQHKLQVSAGRAIGNGTLMFGAFTTIDGRNSIDESGVIVSWWRRF